MKISLPKLLVRVGPATRVAMGLVALMITLLLLSDLFVAGFLPNRAEQASRERTLTAQMLASEVVLSLQARGGSDIENLLLQALKREPTLLSAAVRADSGQQVSAGDHARHWSLKPDSGSTLDNIRAGIAADGVAWGELQLAFRPAMPQSLREWLLQPMVLGAALMAVVGLVAFQLYLRRAMRYLDPSAAVPERVRSALDTLTEGVLVLDTNQHILLANHALRALAPGQKDLAGSDLSVLPWLVREAGKLEGGLPWLQAMAENTPQLGHRLEIEVAGGIRQVVMNCSPVNEGGGHARGCLLTFSDVTELHERTEHLRETLVDLEASREEIRLKNEELTLLATRDPLTGCLNRRAFLEESRACIDAAKLGGQPLSCIMCDIDHFKRINDRYGHGGGDQVLQAVSRALGRGLRTGDLLARFGGEEFCILLPNASLEQGRVIAERLRADIEANAGNAARQLDGVTVTMSFGIEQFGPRTSDFSVLIELADQALYHSKENGRNRVTAWSDMPGSIGSEATASMAMH